MEEEKRQTEEWSRIDIPPICVICRKPSSLFLEDDKGTLVCDHCVRAWSTLYANVTLGELLDFLDEFRDFKSGYYGA